jgi:hypothetical protein
MNNTPLLRSLSYLERKRSVEQESAINLAKASDFLPYLYQGTTIPSNIKTIFSELDKETKRLLPLGKMILNRKPNSDEASQSEGRGIRIRARVKDQTFANIYTKGTGARTRFDEGFDTSLPVEDGLTEKKIYFDDLRFNNHPRIQGTETISWGYMELINCFMLFTSLAEKYNWQNLDDCLAAQISIPLFLNYFPNVTAKINNNLEILKDYLNKQKEVYNTITQASLNDKAMEEMEEIDLKIKNIEWSGNDHLGSVSSIVPSNTRLSDYSNESTPNKEEVFHKNIRQSTIASNIGKTIRNMIDVGISMSSSSSHYGNMYVAVESECSIADYSDFVFLGEYSLNEQISLVMDTFKPVDGFSPPIRTRQEYGYGITECKTAARSFLCTLLKDIVLDSKLDFLTDCYLHEFDETRFVISSLLVNHCQKQNWTKITEARRRIVSDPKNQDYSLETELNNKVKTNLNTSTLQQVISLQNNQGVVKELQDYLIAQDDTIPVIPSIEEYYQIEELSKKYPQTIEQYLEYKDSTLETPKITLNSGEIITHKDFFEPEISVFLAKKIKEQDPNTKTYFEILTLSSKIIICSAHTRTTTNELATTYYPSRILAGENPQELLHKIKCDYFSNIVKRGSHIIVDRNEIISTAHQEVFKTPKGEEAYIPLYPDSILQEEIISNYTPETIDGFLSFLLFLKNCIDKYASENESELSKLYYAKIKPEYEELIKGDNRGILAYELGYFIYKLQTKLQIFDSAFCQNLARLTARLEEEFTQLNDQTGEYQIKGGYGKDYKETYNDYADLSDYYEKAGNSILSEIYYRLSSNELSIFNIVNT